MDTAAIDIFWMLRNAVICSGFLFGIGTAVFLVTRKQKIAGILAAVGFILFSLEPVADIIIYRVLYKQGLGAEMYPTFEYAYLCTSIFAFFMGSIAIAVALINMMRLGQSLSETNSPNASLES